MGFLAREFFELACHESIQYSHIITKLLFSGVPIQQEGDQANTQELCDSSRSKVRGKNSRIKICIHAAVAWPSAFVFAVTIARSSASLAMVIVAQPGD